MTNLVFKRCRAILLFNKDRFTINEGKFVCLSGVSPRQCNFVFNEKKFDDDGCCELSESVKRVR